MAAITPGEHIAELRKTYSISREELSERSGISVDLIAKIENEGLIPDLAPLIKIARALGVRLGTLLDDREELGPVFTRAGANSASVRFVTGLPANSAEQENAQKANEHSRSSPPEESSTEKNHQGLRFKSLAADKNGRHMEPFIVDIESDAHQDKSAHEGEEFIHVLEGNLLLEYGTIKEILKTGDSVYYDSIVPHRVFSADFNPVRILAVIYTPV
ncbi:MAG: XRE family transcriptional regulator [Treponema sp.]|nr:XRE family transcriptional regulator [Treponema sp.]